MTKQPSCIPIFMRRVVLALLIAGFTLGTAAANDPVPGATLVSDLVPAGDGCFGNETITTDRLAPGVGISVTVEYDGCEAHIQSVEFTVAPDTRTVYCPDGGCSFGGGWEPGSGGGSGGGNPYVYREFTAYAHENIYGTYAGTAEVWQKMKFGYNGASAGYVRSSVSCLVQGWLWVQDECHEHMVNGGPSVASSQGRVKLHQDYNGGTYWQHTVYASAIGHPNGDAQAECSRGGSVPQTQTWECKVQ